MVGTSDAQITATDELVRVRSHACRILVFCQELPHPLEVLDSLWPLRNICVSSANCEILSSITLATFIIRTQPVISYQTLHYRTQPAISYQTLHYRMQPATLWRTAISHLKLIISLQHNIVVTPQDHNIMKIYNIAAKEQ